MDESRMNGSDLMMRVLCDGRHLQDRFLRLEASGAGLEVYEVQKNLADSGADATCSFGVELRGGRMAYSWLDLRFRRGARRSVTRVEVRDDCSLFVCHNGVEYSYPTVDDRILLDGPSPMFDWVTAVMIVGVADGEKWEVPVYVVDPDTGSIRRRLYGLRREGLCITIAKGLDPFSDSVIELEEGGLSPRFQRVGGYTIQWE